MRLYFPVDLTGNVNMIEKLDTNIFTGMFQRVSKKKKPRRFKIQLCIQ